MFAFIRKHIKWKIALPIIGIFALTTAVTMYVTFVMFNSAMLSRTSDFLLNQNRAQAYRFQWEVDGFVSHAEVLAGVALTMLETDSVCHITLMEHMEGELAANPLIHGIFAFFEPGEFAVSPDIEHTHEIPESLDSTGRFNAYALRDGGAVRWTQDELTGNEELDAWYLTPMGSGEFAIVGPVVYNDAIGQDERLVSFSTPIVLDGVPLGVVGLDVRFDDMIQGVTETHFFDTGHMFVMSNGGRLYYAHNPDDIGQIAFDYLEDDVADEWRRLVRSEQEFDRIVRFVDAGIDFKISTVPVPIGDRKWHIGSFVPASEIFAETNRIMLAIGGIAGGFGILAVCVIFLLVSRIVSRPVNRMVDIAEDLARGNMAVNIDTSGKDEIGALSRRFARVSKNIGELIGATNSMARAISEQGDLGAEIDEARLEGAYAEMAGSVNSAIRGILNDFSDTFDTIKAITRGDFDADIAAFPGAKSLLNRRIDELRASIKGVNHEVAGLSQAVGRGELAVRISLAEYSGGWKDTMRGLNNLMDAFCEPLQDIELALVKMSQGKLGTRIADTYAGEFGKITARINLTLERIASHIAEVSGVLDCISNNDLTKTVEGNYHGDFADLKAGFNKINETLNRIVSEIKQSAAQVTEGAAIVQNSSQELAHGTQQQSASVQELHASLALISDSTSENAGKARDAVEHSERSMKSAVEGNEDMQRMLASMQGVKEASGKITNINKVIEDIAFQTNLLALNAAVEAARAGEHGLGFSVVAEEVRSLASKSQDAARQTAALIDESVRRVSESMEISGQTAAALGNIVQDVSKVAKIISDIAEESGSQAHMVSQVHQGLTAITEAAQNNSVVTEKTAEASSELTAQAEVMRETVSIFKTKQ